MTLVLSYATAYDVFQAADRRVTRELAGAAHPFDLLSNKVVIYEAQDGVLSIAYSGLAYLDGTQTDRWIAEVLWGSKAADDDGGTPPCMTIGRAPRNLCIGSAIHLLVAELNRAYPHVSLQRFQLSIVGWRWKRELRHPRPIQIWIMNSAGSFVLSCFAIKSPPRHWYLEGADFHDSRNLRMPLLLVSIGREFQGLQKSRLLAKLASSRSPAETGNALAEAIASVARTDSFVGEHCVLIHLPHPRHAEVEVASLSPMRLETSITDGRTLNETVAVSITPWIVSPYRLLAPAVILGSRTESLAKLTLIFHAPPNRSAQVLGAMFSHKRPDAQGRLPPEEPSWSIGPIPDPPPVGSDP